MTDIEEKAEEYEKSCGMSYFNRRIAKAYKDGYEQGAKDIEVLSKENEELKVKYSEHIRDSHDNYFAMCNEKDEEIENLIAQIKKMKCCGNCTEYDHTGYSIVCCKCKRHSVKSDEDKWSFAK